MSQPRNNLDALQRQIPPPQKSSYFAVPPSPRVRSDYPFCPRCRPNSIMSRFVSPINSNLRFAGPAAVIPMRQVTFLASRNFPIVSSHDSVTYSPEWHPPTSLIFHSWLWQTKTQATCLIIFARQFKQRGN